MRRRLGGGRAMQPAIAGLLMLMAVSLWAQSARDVYKEALRAVDDRDWQTAIGLLREAIQENPSENSGTFRRYLPHYYLGLSLFELGNCRAALTVWEESEKQGVITRLKEYQTLRQGVVSCRRRLLRQENESEVAEVSGLASGIAALKSQPELSAYWDQGDPSWADRLEAAQQLLGEAQSLMQRSDSSLSLEDLEKIKANTDSARQLLAIIQREGRSRLSEVRAQVDVRGRLIEMLLDEAREVMTATSYLEPFPRRLGELRQEVERLIASAESTGTRKTPEELEDIRLALSGALERLRRASTPPPDRLREAAEAFLAADHPAVLAILETTDFDDSRAAAHAQLIRGAALYALWVAGGEQDRDRLTAAAEAVHECRQQDASLMPFKAAFSPRFVDFFLQESAKIAPAPLPIDGN